MLGVYLKRHFIKFPENLSISLHGVILLTDVTSYDTQEKGPYG